ncbi:MAG: hypothetical protein JXD23_06135 [Spirochaetales bacterium]|nr:hypothetical protein [Spirochaetales bacterium]
MPDKIILLHQEVGPDAREDEKDTLVQAAFVADSLAEDGWETETLTVDLDLAEAHRRLSARKPSAVFNLVESLNGRGEFIHFAAGLLESLGLPFTGCSSRALFLTSHKLLAKDIMRRSGIPTPDWFKPAGGNGGGGEMIFPCLRKSVWEHASLGMDDSAVIDSEDRLAADAEENGDGFYYERFIDGREFNISLIEENGKARAFPPLEIRFVDYPDDKPKIIGYRAKWESETFEYNNTKRRFDFPDSDRPLLEELEAIALRCYDEFGLAGYARVDFRVDGRGRPWVLEINANPCLSPDAGYYDNALRCGFTRRTLFRTLMENARRKL